MNSDDKVLLSTYRPGTTDDHSPDILRALDNVEKDAELREWFQKQLDMDEAIRSAMANEPAPDNLLGSLIDLTGNPKGTRTPQQKLIPFAMAMGLAACLILGLGFFLKDSFINNQVFGYHPQFSKLEEIDSYREAMSQFVANTFIQLDHYSANHTELNQWLQDKGSPAFLNIPDELEKLQGLGCKKFIWKDQLVSLVCFHAVDGNIVHLFIMDGLQYPEAMQESLFEIRYLNGLPTRGWMDGTYQKSYMLVGSKPEVDLRSFVI